MALHLSADEKAQALLSIVEDVYSNGRDIIGPRWTLMDKMTAYAARNDIEGMRTYYERCLNSDRGMEVRDRLQAAGRKTLELEYGLFMNVYNGSE